MATLQTQAGTGGITLVNQLGIGVQIDTPLSDSDRYRLSQEIRNGELVLEGC
jgi:hypothetical protein